MEELADDVGGGGDAEDDGAEDFLPPWQQQHGVLSPASLAARPVSLYHTHGAVTPVAPSVGEVVAVVYRGEKKKTVRGVLFILLLSFPATVPGSYRMDTGGWTALRCCTHHGKTCRYSDTCRIRQSRPGPVSETGNLRQGQDE